MKKTFTTILLLLGCLVMIGGLFAFKSYSPEQDMYEPQTQWKNLKVLPQDISKDSLFGLMENYSLALGVNCNHCHIPRKDDPSKLDFVSDEKIEKEIARGMIVMTDEINEKYFKPHFPEPKPEQVLIANCVMCHRGTANPAKYLTNMEKMYHSYPHIKERK